MKNATLIRAIYGALVGLLALACPGDGEVDSAEFFRRGDANSDGCIDQADGELILDAELEGGKLDCGDAADANDDGAVTLDDAVYIFDFVELDGDPPPAPFPDCGPDLTDDDLDCGAYDEFLCDTPCEPVAVFWRGDATDDEQFNITDAVATLAFLFIGGEAPSCLDAADVDDDGSVNLTDAVYGLSFLFLGGTPPPPPHPGCGPDPTEDTLTECVFSTCR